MTAFKARVLLIDGNIEHPVNLDAKILARGYHVMRAASNEEAVALAHSDHPDVIIINAPEGGNAAALNETVKNVRIDRNVPLIVIGDRADTDRNVDNQHEGVADYLPTDYRDVELFARLRSLIRLNTIQEELGRRIVTAEQYGIKDTPRIMPMVDISDAKIIVVGPDEAENKKISETVGDGHVVFHSIVTHEAMKRLAEKDIDALILVSDSPSNEYLLFCEDVRNNSRYFNLPILLITDPDCFDDPDRPYEIGVTDVIYRPIDVEELSNRANSLVSQQRYRFGMREIYDDAMRPIVTDGLTGLFNHGFLHESLSKQIAEALRWNKNLTVGFFDVRSLAHFNADYGYVAGDLLIRQISTMINGLLRVEDLSARYGGDEFVVVLPETPPEVAAIALRRIGAVIGSTEFAVADMTEPVPVYLQVGVASAEEGDSAESLIGRAKADLK